MLSDLVGRQLHTLFVVSVALAQKGIGSLDWRSIGMNHVNKYMIEIFYDAIGG